MKKSRTQRPGCLVLDSGEEAYPPVTYTLEEVAKLAGGELSWRNLLMFSEIQKSQTELERGRVVQAIQNENLMLVILNVTRTPINDVSEAWR